MKPLWVLLLLLPFAGPSFAATPFDVKAETFKLAVQSANDALELHNTIAAAAESIQATATDRRKRDMELLGIVLGSYRIYYKQYCTILQEVDRLEKKAAPSAADCANRAELWRRLGMNRTSVWNASMKVARLSSQMGISVPAKWNVAINPLFDTEPSR